MFYIEDFFIYILHKIKIYSLYFYKIIKIKINNKNTRLCERINIHREWIYKRTILEISRNKCNRLK